jgi:translation initiation factor IF-1
MQNKDSLEAEGTVIETLQNGVYRVELANGHRLLAHVSGELRMNFTKVLPADKVLLEISPYDLSRGRIVRRRE